jgi:large subunit ribosomal protein L19
MNRLDAIEKAHSARKVPPLRAGDMVRIHNKIKEGNRERVQIFEGVVLRVHGSGTRRMVTVRKVSYGVGVERIFPVQSPALAQIELVSRGKVRQSRIYYMRERFGKKARLERESVVAEDRNSTELNAGESAKPEASEETQV